MPPLSDTSPQAHEVYLRRLAEMTPSERLGIGAALWEAADSVQRAAARKKWPDADEVDITVRIAAAKFGSEFAQKAYKRP